MCISIRISDRVWTFSDPRAPLLVTLSATSGLEHRATSGARAEGTKGPSLLLSTPDGQPDSVSANMFSAVHS